MKETSTDFNRCFTEFINKVFSTTGDFYLNKSTREILQHELRTYCFNWPFVSYKLEDDDDLEIGRVNCENFEILEHTNRYLKVRCGGDWQPATIITITEIPEYYKEMYTIVDDTILFMCSGIVTENWDEEEE